MKPPYLFLLLLLLTPTLVMCAGLGGTRPSPNEKDWKENCLVTTTANITIATALNPGDTLNGVTLATGNRVLVKDQSTASQNGIWIAAPTPYRATDSNSWEQLPGSVVLVTSGTASSGTAWRNNSAIAGTLESTAITYTAFPPPGAGTGDLLAANNLSDVASAATARTNLGLADMATQASTAVSITGGAIDGVALTGSTIDGEIQASATFTDGVATRAALGMLTDITFGDGTAQPLTFTFDIFDSDSTFVIDDNEWTFGAGSVNFGSAGVKLSHDGDGALTFTGMGNGADEDLTLNLDDTANTGVWSSSTGLALFDFGSISLKSTIGTDNAAITGIGTAADSIGVYGSNTTAAGIGVLGVTSITGGIGLVGATSDSGATAFAIQNDGGFQARFAFEGTANRAINISDQAGTIAFNADASGFDGNLTTDDDTLQEIAQALDDLAIGSGAVATDAIWDAAGDLVYGTGANTAARLPKGTSNQLLQMNSGATAPEWTSDAELGTLTASSVLPASNDGAALGNGTTAFSDLFLASGGVVNFANGDWIGTHSTGIFTVGTGDLRVTTAGTNTASVVTVGGTQTLTSKSLTTPTVTTANLSGAQQLAEGASVRLDAAGSADGAFSGTTIAGTAGATLAFGDIVYLAAADSRWELADADSATTSGNVLVGAVVLAAASDGDPTVILLNGTIRADTAFPTFTISAPAYISATAGDATGTAPSTTGQIVRRIGFALTADELYFSPSPDSGTAP